MITLQNIVNEFESLLLPILIFFLLTLLVKKRLFPLFSLKSFLENISLFVLNNIALTPIMILYFDVFHFETLFLNDTNFWSKYPQVFCFVIILLVGDFIGYWRHRLEHSPFFWPIHLIHHTDKDMFWLTLHRLHPISRIANLFIDGGILYFLGFPLEAVIFNSVFRHYYGYFIHADLPWHYGKLNKVFVSPLLHQAHHAQPREYHHSNFATLFSFYDVLFNTYKMPSSKNFELGVAYAEKMSLMEQLVYPFKKSSYFKFKTKQ